MPRKELLCIECDSEFVVQYRGSDSVAYCPFCGADIVQDDGNDLEDYDD